MSAADQTEKAPLLETGTEPTPTLEVLKQRVFEAHANWLQARQTYWTELRRTSRFHRYATRISVSFAVFILCFFLLVPWLMLALDDDDDDYIYRRVPLEAHIMSKCPDAKDCLRQMVLPAMQNVSGIVDFKLSYIGT